MKLVNQVCLLVAGIFVFSVSQASVRVNGGPSWDPEYPNLGTDIVIGTEVGNGGFLVRCVDEHGHPHFYSSDIYNLVSVGKWNPDRRIFSGTAREIVFNILKNFSIIDPNMADLLLNEFRLFDAKTSDLMPTENLIKPLMAEGDVELPESCRREQVFSRMKTDYSVLFDDRWEYRVDRDLFDQLDEVNKAAAILHELAYLPSVNGEHASYEEIVAFNMRILSLPVLY